MGASLLDQVLAETLDPAYAQAAAARAAAPVDPGSAAARRSRLRGQVLVALVLAIAGLLAAVTYDQVAAGADGREKVRQALLSDIDRDTGATADLTAQLDALRGQVTSTRDTALRATSVGSRALDQLATAEQGAGTVAVTGPGLLVTLANATPNADSDPVGGSDQVDPNGLVRDGDIQLVVNALWAAGAEAIGINGQRLGPTSAIRFAGEAVLVDFNPVMNPYQIRAIGDPDTMRDAFLASPEVGSLAVISESFGLRFEFTKESSLSLPADSPPELRFATAVPPAGSVPATTGDGP
jgi:uncharacterized protein YlxW (UPF0749 family)